MILSEKQKKFLRGLAHPMKPVVLIGNAGLTESVLREINLSLDHHELLKVRVNAGDREERQAIIDAICTETAAVSVQRVGHIVVLYRAAKKPRIQLPG